MSQRESSRRAQSTTSSTLYLMFILAGFAFISLLFARALEIDGSDLSLTLILLNRFYVDALVTAAVCLLLFSTSRWLRWISYLFVSLVLFAQLMQYLSFQYAKSFVPTVAVENVQHVNLLDTTPLFIVLGSWLLVSAAVIMMLARTQRSTMGVTRRSVIAIFLVIAAVALHNDHKWLPDDLVHQRSRLYFSGEPGITHDSPAAAFYGVLADLARSNYELRQLTRSGNRLTPAERDFVAKHGLSWAEYSAQFPLIKSAQHGTLNGLHVIKGGNPNVIVLFLEGVSSRTIQPYSNRFPGISPNIAAFSREAFRFDAYYNHTFATYRGLSGQHCSSFPTDKTEPETQYRCLSHILNEHGYQTQFMISQKRSQTYLDEMLKQVGFDEVFAYEELTGKSTGPEIKRVSDLELFQKLTEHLETGKVPSDAPFYLGVYSFETHTGVIPTGDSILYERRPRDDKSYVLDTLHNLDRAFGVFWDYFKQSRFADNTIVIVTSDHAHFPDRHFRALLKDDKNYSPLFMDRIPLLIYSPFHQQTGEFPVAKASSLDFAPSVLHLLGINHYESTFLGHSLFEPTFRMVPVASGNRGIMFARSGLTWALDEHEQNPNYKTMQNLIKRTQALELDNKLWSRSATP